MLLVGQKMLQKMGNHQSKQKYAKISIGFCFGTEGVLEFVHKLGHIWKSKPKSRVPKSSWEVVQEVVQPCMWKPRKAISQHF